MRLMLAGLAALVSVPAFAQPAPNPGAPPTALVREGVTEKLTDHVWAIPDGSASLVPNVGIIVGGQAVMVVDTGMGVRNGQTVLKEVEKVAPGKPIYIVSTHFHPEHDFGAMAFPRSAKMIRSKDQEAEIVEGGMQLAGVFAARSELNKELLKDAAFRPADITFEKETEIDLGGVKARVIAMGLNHTKGDTVVLADGVLFSGDVAMRPQPSIMNPQATLTQWLASLDRLAALKPVHVVPSHGQRGDIKIIDGYKTYLTRIRDRAAELKKSGKTLEETTTTITDELSAQYPDKPRLGGAIRAAYNEAK